MISAIALLRRITLIAISVPLGNGYQLLPQKLHFREEQSLCKKRICMQIKQSGTEIWVKESKKKENNIM